VSKDVVNRLAQDQKRLGRLECTLAANEPIRAVDPRRHGGSRPARPQGHVDLAARGHRRAHGRAEGAARGQAHRQRIHRCLAKRSQRSDRAWSAAAGTPHHRRRAGIEKAIDAVWDGVPVQRCSVHKHRNLLAHAPERLFLERMNLQILGLKNFGCEFSPPLMRRSFRRSCANCRQILRSTFS